MKKLLLIGMVVLTSCANNDLNQQTIETWIRTNTVEKGTSFTSNFKNNYGAKHSATMQNISITDIGVLEIKDETTRSISAKISYQEKYFNGSWSSEKNKKKSLVFVFKKSSDNNWYLSKIRGDSNQPFGAWVSRIEKDNQKTPL